MSARQANFLRQLAGIFILCAFLGISYLGVFASENVTSVAQSGNAVPVISNIKINNNNPIVLTTNTTTQVQVSYTVSDDNGCGDVFFLGLASTTLYRSSSGPACSFSYNNCYILSGVTSHSCPSETSTNLSADATTTFSIYYFADATDASSSYPAQDWRAYVNVRDSQGSSSPTSTPTGVEVNTLTAIALSTSTINYGSVQVGSNTGGTNKQVDAINVGNSSTSLQVSGTDMTGSGNTIVASKQHFATSTFNYGGAEQLLSGVATAVSGWLANHGPNIRSWQNTTALPNVNYLHANAAYGEYLYSIGGNSGGLTSTVLFARINATGSIGTWSETTPLPSANNIHTAIANRGFVYVIGGNTGASTSTVMFAAINSTGSIGSWNTTNPLPFATYRHSSVLYRDYIYTLGGVATAAVNFAAINSTGSVGAWTSTTPLPYADQYLSAVAYNGFIYAVGGTSSGTRTSTVSFAPINSTGSVGAWTSTTPLPYVLSNHDSFVYDKFVYIVAGDADSGATSTVLFAPINSDGTLGVWQRATSLGFTLMYHRSIGHNGYAYSIGGSANAVVSSTILYSKLFSQPTYWGLEIPSSTPANISFTGTNTFTAVFSP